VTEARPGARACGEHGHRRIRLPQPLNRYTNAEIDGLNRATLANPPTAASLALF
jgi:hypothetical protein